MMPAMASVAILLLALGLASRPRPPPRRSPPRREAVVVKTVENMYSAPSLDKDVTSQAFLGQIVAVLETKGAFAKIETPDRLSGLDSLVARSGRYPSATAPRGTPLEGRVAEVVSLVALVYREADVTTYRPKARAPLGARLELVKEAADGRWHRVRLPDGRGGLRPEGRRGRCATPASKTLARRRRRSSWPRPGACSACPTSGAA